MPLVSLVGPLMSSGATRAPIISGPLIATGQVDVPFTYAIRARYRPTSFDASVPPPAGLVVDLTTGVISGTPSTEGTTPVTITARNDYGTDTATLSITIVPARPVVTDPGPQTWQVDVPITNIQVIASGNPTNWALSGQPAGISISSTGLISGTPAVGTPTGPRVITITATNAGGASVGVPMAVTILAAALPPPVVTAAALTRVVGTAWTHQIVASNGPLDSFRIAGEPAGVTVNATGLISGTAAIPIGVHTIQMWATNATGESVASANLTVTITAAAAPVINSSLAETATIDSLFSYTITASNTPTSFDATGLPAWLSRTGAVISGTPPTGADASSPYSISISATNAGGTDTRTLLLTVIELTTSDVLAIGNNTARPPVGAENGSLYIVNNTDSCWVWVGVNDPMIDDWYSSTGSVTP